MKPEVFAEKIYKTIACSGVDSYWDALNSSKPTQITDPYWQSVVDLLSKLDDSDKEIVRNIIRQVSVDTVSHVLAIIDGVSTLEDDDTEYALTADGETVISGNLQSFFLEVDEENQETL